MAVQEEKFRNDRHLSMATYEHLINLQFSTSISEAIKTDSAYQCYIHVTEDEIGGMKWLDKKKNSGTIDTYMDTCEQSKNKNTRNSLKSWWARQALNLRPDDYESSALTN